jgi:hypothetical protein
MLYSKNGSIPKPETDGTDGWIEVPEPPECPEGKEVVWWYPPSWIIRDPKPEGDWSWNQSSNRWIEVGQITTTNISGFESSQISGLNG